MSIGRVDLAPPDSGPSDLHPAFRSNSYLVRRQFFKLFGAGFHIYDASGNLVLYSKELPFRLRDDFRIFSDESETEELLNIKTPNFVESWAVFNVVDSHSGEELGGIQRKWLQSMLRDEWAFLSNTGVEIGRLVEAGESAIMSRLLSNWIPQYYDIIAGDGRKLAEIQQQFNPFIRKYTVNILEPDPAIDRRLVLAAGLLLAGVEGRQEELFSVGAGGVGGLMGTSHGDYQEDSISPADSDSTPDVDDSSSTGDLFGGLGSSLFGDDDKD